MVLAFGFIYMHILQVHVHILLMVLQEQLLYHWKLNAIILFFLS
jgi:hypothetical protein